MADTSGALGQALSEAFGMLLDAGLVRAAERAVRANLVHTVGEVHGPLADVPGTCRVHTLDRVTLRPAGQLAPSPQWLHRERPRALGCSAVLTHGRMAGRLVVQSALVPGERVYCLPVLPSPAVSSAARRGPRGNAARLDARLRLGVPPGVRVVIGTPRATGGAVGDWATALRRLGRRDLLVIDVPEGGMSSPAGRSGPSWPLLLEAADLFVAAGRELTATSAAVSSLELGIPVVTVTTDSAAELVTPGRDGRLVAPRVDAIVDAVVSTLDAAWLPGRAPVAPGPPLRIHDLAGHLLSIYAEALAAPAPTGWCAR
ncbi:MAG: glycosyltransferase [Blastococcus sp.]